MAAPNWQSYDLSRQDQQRRFLLELSQTLAAIQAELVTPSYFANLLNGQGLLNVGSLILHNYQNTSAGATTTRDCTGASLISVHIAVASVLNPTLTLNNVTNGALMVIRLANTAGSSQTFKVSGTDPSANALTFFYKTSSALTNMTSTGLSIGVGATIIAAGSLWADHSAVLVAN
jgi:hypothetical protein